MSNDFALIQNRILAYVKEAAIVARGVEIPLDKSLLEAGIIDSFGIIEMIAFLEKEWTIKIRDEDITKEKMGSINKMAQLVIDCLKDRM